MITFRDAKVAVTRAMDILEEIYPSRVMNKKVTEAGAATHLEWLGEAAIILDRLDHNIDVRPNLDPRKRAQTVSQTSS